MRRYLITPLAATGSHGTEAPFTVEGATIEAALAADFRIYGGSTKANGRDLVRVDAMTDTGEVESSLCLVDRVPTGETKGSYNKTTEQPQDTGGSDRKRVIRQPFAPVPHEFPQTRGMHGQTIEKVRPDSGNYATRGERKQAIMDLAKAELGTLNGIAVGRLTAASIGQMRGLDY
jgi:hypothetical protein